ncbi:DEAD-box ATP-dependent RNA helicase 58, chloroplastic isoform X1 [Amborella trichopoda]|nr:DEAD-box ATP-dependent RNA helicase 58, chloroplastic isoform X1 [Amborella trichopoda]|eukprot:XP_020518806.1 DEAD-box ATP-dependent RNA helicase 58, chloroplastic isoform X1 [Amborella trichopoda]
MVNEVDAKQKIQRNFTAHVWEKMVIAMEDKCQDGFEETPALLIFLRKSEEELVARMALVWLPPFSSSSIPQPTLFFFNRGRRGRRSAAAFTPQAPHPHLNCFCSHNNNEAPYSLAASSSSLREICCGRVPETILQRAEEIGFVRPTHVQQRSLPTLLSGRDCILHAQTGSGKTLAYLLVILSAIDVQQSAVQALVVVPSRELGMQVTKVARMLATRSMEFGMEQRSYTVMALLDGGMLKRHKIWFKAEPPQIVVATIDSLCQMIEKQDLKLDSLRVLVIDEVDFLFNSSKQVHSLRKLLTSYSAADRRQTIFSSASIPQHKHFVHDCIQQKWTKRDVVHIHLHPVEPMPSRLCHIFVTCKKEERLQTLLSLLQQDIPKTGIIFVNEQSQKSIMAGNPPPAAWIMEFLRTSSTEFSEIFLLEEGMSINARTLSLSEARQGRSLLVATDLASRGVDLPETTHIYNFDLPRTAIEYLHRAGRTGRRPFSDEMCTVTNLIAPEERFVLQRYENELMFECKEFVLHGAQEPRSC